MHTKNLLALILFIFTLDLFAQTPEENERKYELYRERLKKEMMVFSDNGFEKGANLPMERKAYVNEKVVGYWADATWWQGHYIAMLATEYRRLQLSKENTVPTLRELKAALDVYDRLDLAAEACWGADTFKHYNGFYIRDDITLKETSNLHLGAVQSDYHYYCGESGAKRLAPSQDQAWATYLGLALVQKLVDDSAVFHHTEAIAERLVRGMQYTDVKGHPHWQIVNPVTGEIIQKEGDIQWLQYAHGAVGTLLTGKNLHFGKSEKKQWENIWEILQDNVLADRDGHFTWYGVMALSTVLNDGGTDNCYEWLLNKCRKIANRRPDLEQSLIFPHLALINLVLYNHEGQTLAPEEPYTFYLNSAPKSGAHAFTINGETSRTPAPWHSLSLFCPWHNQTTGEFNMIDYMLLYNLVMLVYH